MRRNVFSTLNSVKMAGVIKQSTNITGLQVCVNAKYILNRIYKRTSNLLIKMPENSAYRKYAQDIINQRAAIINSTEDIKIMEEKIGCGQIEEVIQQARCELELAQKFVLMKPWENLKTPPPENQWTWPVK